MRDSTGATLNVGDHVQVYFGYNRLKPGVIHKIQGQKAKVLVEGAPALSKWKPGTCMVKVPDPYRPYPEEVYGLLDFIIKEKNNLDYPFEVRLAIRKIQTFWEMNRPMQLVTS